MCTATELYHEIKSRKAQKMCDETQEERSMVGSAVIPRDPSGWGVEKWTR